MSKGTVNKAILIGRLGQDPQTLYMPNGVCVVNLSIATTESWKDTNTGQPAEKTEWHRVVIYNKLAETAAEYLRKGAKVYLEGRLETQQWEKDGQKHYTTQIVVNEMTMLDRAGDNAQAPAPQPRPQQQPSQAPPAQSDGFDDDIPF